MHTLFSCNRSERRINTNCGLRLIRSNGPDTQGCWAVGTKLSYLTQTTGTKVAIPLGALVKLARVSRTACRLKCIRRGSYGRQARNDRRWLHTGNWGPNLHSWVISVGTLKTEYGLIFQTGAKDRKDKTRARKKGRVLRTALVLHFVDPIFSLWTWLGSL